MSAPITPGETVKAFREYLRVHPIGGQLSGSQADDMALELARVALDFQPSQAPAAPRFDDLSLATSALSMEERAKWINVLDPLLKYAGSPGDWGRESKLGLLTVRLMQVRQELVRGDCKEGGAA